MSYLPPNPYASRPPVFPPQGGLGGQPTGFPGASPFSAPAPQPDPMAALQGLQGGGFPGAQQADPMAALQGLQGGGFPGAAGMGQDTFAPQQADPMAALQGAQPPAAQGQQAGVFQHQSGGFADKNSSLSSGGGFWTSWKGISTIAGSVLGAVYTGFAIKNGSPFFWKWGKDAAETGTKNLVSSFTAAKSSLKEHDDNIFKNIKDKVTNKKADELATLQTENLEKVKDFANGFKEYNGVGGALSDGDKTKLSTYATKVEELFTKASEQVKDGGSIDTEFTAAKTAYDEVGTVLNTLKGKIATNGFGKRQPVSDLLAGLTGKDKAAITEAIKDGDSKKISEYTDGLKELVEGDGNTGILDALKTKFDDITGAADDNAAKEAVKNFQTAFDKIDSDILKKGGTHTAAIQKALTGEADTLKGNVIKAEQLENGGAAFKDELGKLKEKAGKLLKDDQGTEQLTQSLDEYLKPENFGKQEAKEKFQKAFDEVTSSKLAQTPTQKKAAEEAQKAADAKAEQEAEIKAKQVARGHYDNLPQATNKLTGDDLKAKVEAAKADKAKVEELAQAAKAEADKDFNPVLAKAESTMTAEQKNNKNHPVNAFKTAYHNLFKISESKGKGKTPIYTIAGQDQKLQKAFAKALKELEKHFPQA